MTEFGLNSFGDVSSGADGAPRPHAAVIREAIEQGVLAERSGVDVFALGEHHRADYAVSAPEMVLAAIAGRTARIRLGSAVTVLSSDDPVRVFQRFSTLDAASNGRAEVVLGRGSFTESFPLFGHDLADYEALFEEKLELFAALRRGGPIHWSGSTRAPLAGVEVFPPVEGGPLRAWVGSGGSPDSVVRAARHDLPVMLAIIGGDPARFRPLVELHRRAAEHFGHPVRPLGVHSPGHVADTDARAREEFWPHYAAQHDRIGAGRGWPKLERAAFEREIERGSLYVGAPDTVARKVAGTVSALGLDRFDLKYGAGTLPHDALMRAVDLYGGAVIPAARALLG